MLGVQMDCVNGINRLNDSKIPESTIRMPLFNMKGTHCVTSRPLSQTAIHHQSDKARADFNLSVLYLAPNLCRYTRTSKAALLSSHFRTPIPVRSLSSLQR